MLTWKVKKLDSTDRIKDAIMFLDEGGNKVPLLDGAENSVKKLPAANRSFGERIEAVWKNLDFNLILKNLQYTDTVSFYFRVEQQANDFQTNRNTTSKSISITEVKGMYAFLEALYCEA